MSNTEITWNCNVCGFPISDGTGYLSLDMAVVSQVEQALHAWKAEHPDGASVDELMRYPQSAPWTSLHRDCDPDPEGPSYWYDIDRCRTHQQLLARTAHLMGKRWFKATNWDEIIGRKAGDA